MNEMFNDLYPDVAVPEPVWRWIDSAQHTLAVAGAARALSVVDLLVCAVASSKGLVVLHDDADFDLAAHHLRDVEAQRVVAVDR
jgi:predicted nucleic acid-binding protein